MKLRFLPIILILFLLCGTSYSKPKARTILSKEVTSSIQFVEDFRIQIVNSKNGSISISKNKGISFEVIGHVLWPVKQVNEKGYTASQWANSGEVIATAVNAIHIKVANPKTIFSILPNEFSGPVSKYGSYFSSSSSIYTGIPAGKIIFGGGFAPFLGNKVMVSGKGVSSCPKIGDIITIIVERPIKWPTDMIFENRFGGKIIVNYINGSAEVVGEVLRPVQGVGRFEGSRFLSPGRIRANHPGVIDISTSTGGLVGGFQIIPANHAQSPEMGGARIKTQWMVVGGISVFDKSPEGLPPLFKYFIKPQYDPDDINSPDWETKFLQRFLVQVKLSNKKGWQPIPVYGLRKGEDLPAAADRLLENVDKIRILFPEL